MNEDQWTEGQLEKWAKDYAKTHGVLMYKFRTPANRGLPDDILFYDGKCVLVEFKSPKGTGTLSPLQEREIAKIRSQGIHVFTCASVGTFKAIINAIKGSYEIE